MEFGKLFTYVSPAGTISDAGIVEITRLIQSQDLTTAEWRSVNPDCAWRVLPALPSDWAYVWIIAKGEFAGTFPKRVRSFFYKNYKIKCLDGFIAKLGEIARAHSAENVTYHYEFVDSFDWQSGEFGDAGSCYWGSNSEAREMLSENGAWAIRFYDETGKGYARAWVYQADDSLYIVWNGYGKPFANPTITIARVVAAHFNLSYKRIRLENNGTDTGTLYINSGAGYAIADVETLDGVGDFDLEWDDPNGCQCHNCGDRINEDDAYYGADDMQYCEHCYYQYFGSCDRCGETYDRDNLTYADGGDYCEYCLDQHFTYCEKCGEYVRNQNAVEVDGSWYCQNCAPEEESDPEE